MATHTAFSTAGTCKLLTFSGLLYLSQIFWIASLVEGDSMDFSINWASQALMGSPTLESVAICLTNPQKGLFGSSAGRSWLPELFCWSDFELVPSLSDGTDSSEELMRCSRFLFLTGGEFFLDNEEGALDLLLLSLLGDLLSR